MDLERIENGKIFTYCTTSKCYLFDETTEDRKIREQQQDQEQKEEFQRRCENDNHDEKMHKKRQKQHEKWLAKYC